MNLDDLVDIVEPPPIAWTPQTVGWLVLLVAVFVIGAAALRAWLRHSAANRYRREALAELDTLGQPTVAAINSILKRTAMVAYSRERVAALAGNDWVTFLGNTVRGAAPDAEQAALLSDGGYSRHDGDGNVLMLFARAWVNGHRARPQEER